MSRNSPGPRMSCRFRLARSSVGSDLSSRAAISRAASFKAVRAVSLGCRRLPVRERLFRRCLVRTFSINDVSEQCSCAAAFSAAPFRLESIRSVICAVFLWRITETVCCVAEINAAACKFVRHFRTGPVRGTCFKFVPNAAQIYVNAR
jgi:hypothetical protein